LHAVRLVQFAGESFSGNVNGCSLDFSNEV